MKKCNTFLWLALFMLAFCPLANGGNPEKLLGVTLDNDKQEITIHVVSSGCTQKTDFSFEMKGDTLTIVRIKYDDCKAMGSEVQFSWSLKEAGINPNKPFVIRNKFIVNPFIEKIQ
ncbi:MAG: hypothetical protein NTY07_15990 [Bacteroidia bacterium]|nr:hypothetical protein [Bacteroidia bacterium]